MPSFRPIIRTAYREILRREPDSGGLENFNRLMNQGLTEARMRESLLRSDEYAQQNPDVGLGPRIGLNVHLSGPEVLDDVGSNLGIRWIRVGFDWFRIEPNRGDFRWFDTDREVQAAEERGISILGILAYTPPWASSNPGNPLIADPPASRAFWTDFVRATVSRYRDRVAYWQMWNEANVREFWLGTRQQYRTEILEPGARTASEASPGIQVVAPGFANLGSWRDWFREAMNASDLIDIVNHHNYADTGREALEELEQDSIFQPSLRTLMRQAGVDDLPFWLTETGRRTAEGDQLRYYQDLVATLRQKTWVERVFFYRYWDGPGAGDTEWGIVNEDFSPKPTYRFLQAVVEPGLHR